MSAAAPRQRIHTFLVLKQAGQPDRVLVWDTQDISVGRAPENDLCIDHSEVSRRHALLSRTDRAFAVRNLSQSNGTTVNGTAVDTHELASRDVIQIGELQLHFYQGARNPATLGPRLEYSSQLKDFGSARDAASPDSTMLGLVDAIDDDDEFEVRPASDFAYDLHGMEKGSGPAPRNLDVELADLEMPGSAEAAEPAARAAPAAGRLSLHLEIEGLTPELGRQLGSLLGKVVELPGLRIRIKGDDRD